MYLKHTTPPVVSLNFALSYDDVGDTTRSPGLGVSAAKGRPDLLAHRLLSEGGRHSDSPGQKRVRVRQSHITTQRTMLTLHSKSTILKCLSHLSLYNGGILYRGK